jgi:nucleotide-binding universal stress UspA family protein
VHILIATDGSQRSIRAAHKATELLRAADHVTLLSVLTEVPGDDAGGIEGSVYTVNEQEQLWNEEMAEARDELSRTAAALSPTRVDKRIAVGDVAQTVVRIAEEIHADAIVVGSHGRTGLERLFLGSVSEHVVRHAHCPVLVVREPKED